MDYTFGIQFILLLSMLRNLRHKWLSTCSLRIVSVCPSSSLLLLFHARKTTENFKNVEANAKKKSDLILYLEYNYFWHLRSYFLCAGNCGKLTLRTGDDLNFTA